MSSPYRTEPLAGAFGILSTRKSLQQVPGVHWKNSTRNPAFCVVSGGGQTVPVDKPTFDSLYETGQSRRPDPILKTVTVTQNGSGGTGLVLEAEATIQCHTQGQFQAIEAAFCKTGQLVTIAFGYKNPMYADTVNGATISGFTVTTFKFNTTPEGYWIVTFRALAPGMAGKELVISNKIKGSIPNRQFKLEDKTYPVTNLIELITFWGQSNGKTAIDEAEDGTVTVPDIGVGAVVIYDPEHLQNKDSKAGKTNSGDSSNVDELSKTNNIVYVSLEAIMEMLNYELVPEYAAAATPGTKQTLIDMKFKFHETYSYSYVDKKCRSAYPTRVLILGPEISNYKNVNQRGKDFLEGVTDAAALTAVVGEAEDRSKIDLKKILIERSIVLNALGGKVKDPRHAEKVDAKENQEGSVKIKDFFSNISQVIKEATGDAISLVLSLSPSAYESAKENNTLYIFDENSGYASGPSVFVFDPVDYDGSTRTCEIKSDVGSETMQAAAFSSALKSNDPISEAQGETTDNTTAGRSGNYSEALSQIDKIINDPGVLGDSAFDEQHMQALRDQLCAVRLGAPKAKTVDLSLYPGIGISIEIDGVWGITPGNGIWSQQMPRKYYNNKSYFWVTTVTHTFDGNTSDWATKLEGVLTNHTSPKYIF